MNPITYTTLPSSPHWGLCYSVPTFYSLTNQVQLAMAGENGSLSDFSPSTEFQACSLQRGAFSLGPDFPSFSPGQLWPEVEDGWGHTSKMPSWNSECVPSLCSVALLWHFLFKSRCYTREVRQTTGGTQAWEPLGLSARKLSEITQQALYLPAQGPKPLWYFP